MEKVQPKNTLNSLKELSPAQESDRASPSHTPDLDLDIPPLPTGGFGSDADDASVEKETLRPDSPVASPEGNIVADLVVALTADKDTAPVVEEVPITAGPSVGVEVQQGGLSGLDLMSRSKSLEPMASNQSSPLSDLPNLPSQDPLSPSFRLTMLTDIPDGLPAESSAQAGKRSKLEAAKIAREKKALAKSEKAQLKAKEKAGAKTKPKAPKKGKEPKEAMEAEEAKEPKEKEKQAEREGTVDSLLEIAQPVKTRNTRRRKRGVSVNSLVEDPEAEEKAAARKKRKLANKAAKPRRKLKARAPILTDAQLRANMKGQTREVQSAACHRTRYAKWGKCTQCTSKSGWDCCRFKDFRVFPVDSETGDITGPGYFESTSTIDNPTSLPVDFTAPLQEETLERIDRIVAPILLPMITRELRHVINKKAMTRAIDSAIDRSFCDFCSGTIFAGSFFCRKCGRDYCLECERYFSENQEEMDKSPWELDVAARPRLLRCLLDPDAQEAKKGEDQEADRDKDEPKMRDIAWHFRGDLQPVSRFTEKELMGHWKGLQMLELEKDKDKEKGEGKDEGKGKGKEKATGNSVTAELGTATAGDTVHRPTRSQSSGSGTGPAEPTDKPPPPPSVDIDSFYNAITRPPVPLPLDPADLRQQSLKIIRITTDALDNPLFDRLWAKGEPIVVDGLLEKFKTSWIPEEMIARFGNQKCDINQCGPEGETWRSTVKKFFEEYKDAHRRDPEDIWCMKDWPPTDDLSKTLPGLYDEFCEALPVPDYTRQNGSMNLFAHFPLGPTKPDIGPKMYNAFGGDEGPGGHGSTRLHMDVADAVNIMLYASDLSQKTPTEPLPESTGLAMDVDPSPSGPPPPTEPTEPTGPTETPQIAKSSTLPSSISTTTTGETLIPQTRSRSKSNATTASSSKSLSHSPTTSHPKSKPKPKSTKPDNSNKRKSGPEGQATPPRPGCAVWDIFRAEDADKLRQFLIGKFDPAEFNYTDPIHSQMFYLDADLRKELCAKKKVASFRIYQYPGQAVFIPAGCAHQVCNLADCIKIAMDFVSPHNIARCQQLTQDFRKENFVNVWKDDVLQLYNILWFAWLSSRETRERIEKETQAKELDHATTLADLSTVGSGLVPTGSIGRSMTSSVRDDPASLPSPLLPPPPPPSSAPPAPDQAAAGSDEADLDRLLREALAAPDPPQPEESRQKASRGKKRLWSGFASTRRTRSSVGAGVGGGREASPLVSLTVGEVRARLGSKKQKKGTEGMEGSALDGAMEIIKAEMGQGGGEVEEDGMRM